MKKKFITVITLQKPETLKKNIYEAVDNEKLRYDTATAFPVIPLIAGYAKTGDDIEVIAICHEYENSVANLETFKKELSDLAEGHAFTYSLDVLSVPYDNQVSTQLKTFYRLAEKINDGDDINACLTYGTKPLSIIELMTLNYAYRAKKDCSYGALVYGELDHNTGNAKIYDVTRLFIVDEIVRRGGNSQNLLNLLDRMINDEEGD